MKSTEMRNKDTVNISEMSCIEQVELMQKANIEAVNAVGAVTEDIALAVQKISERMKKGGRLFYIGCGTSGRLGVLDASECPPTFGVSKDLVVGIIAGGDYALRHAIEKVEDSIENGKRDFIEHNPTANDTLVGISAAGDANYVKGAILYAEEIGALTVGITCNTDSFLATGPQINIVSQTGPEIIAGSTRMKAGTSQKLILNMISTAVMINMGYVYENMMVNLKPMNKKLEKRMLFIVSEMADVDEQTAKKALQDNDWVIRQAVEYLRNKQYGNY